MPNAFDLLVVIILILGMFFGAARGGLRQLASLVSAWLSLVVSLFLYPIFSREILQGLFTEASPAVMDTFAFIILIIVFTGAFQLIFILTTNSGEEKVDRSGKSIQEKLDHVDDFSIKAPFSIISGLIVGFIATLVWLSLLTVATQFALGGVAMVNPTAGSVLGTINSAVTTPFLRDVVSLIYRSVEWVNPGNVPSIFRGIV